MIFSWLQREIINLFSVVQISIFDSMDKTQKMLKIKQKINANYWKNTYIVECATMITRLTKVNNIYCVISKNILITISERRGVFSAHRRYLYETIILCEFLFTICMYDKHFILTLLNSIQMLLKVASYTTISTNRITFDHHCFNHAVIMELASDDDQMLITCSSATLGD